jgi:hypothetical protein
MRSGKHIGKIVISDSKDANVSVPIRRAPKTLALKPDVAYLIVGGLKGLCGSLAIFLAQNGARKLVVMSRSGCGDDRSQRIIKDCLSHGCTIYVASGDVSNIADVRRAFESAQVQVRGVVQGAMVLRVSGSLP